MNKKVIIKLLVVIVISALTFSFSKKSQSYVLEGRYYLSLKLKDEKKYLNFKNDSFEIGKYGHLGHEYQGKGYFNIAKNKLILNYNKKLVRPNSFYRSFNWQNDSDLISIDVKVMDLKGTGISMANFYSDDGKISAVTDSNGELGLKLPKKDIKQEFEVSYIGFGGVKISLDQSLNQKVEFFLSDKSEPMPIYNQIDTLEILELKKDYFISKNKDGSNHKWIKEE